ncbi:MAG: hypothetical protein IT168_05905 [Bryobacterales bacterium]|nr:hypothetical protein [Bryobacterales bacterium]
MNQQSVPEWVNETPDETTYDLVMFDEGGGPAQRIELTRDEFVGLKEHLASMRGLVPPASMAEAPVGRVTQHELNAFLDLYEAFYRLVYGAARRAAEYGIEPGEIDADVMPEKVDDRPVTGFDYCGFSVSRRDC